MCDEPYTPIYQQEITSKATFQDHSLPSHTRRLLLLFLSVLLLASCGLLGSKKKDHGLPGFIVFSAKDSLGHNELFRMKPDGSDIRQLTHMGSDGAWSPDGSQIAFVSNRDYYQADTLRFRTEIYKINVSNKEVTKLTNLGKVIQRPVWSPDKSFIVFNSNEVNEDGVDITLINNQNEIHSLEKLRYGGDTFWYSNDELLIFGKTMDDQLVTQLINLNGQIINSYAQIDTIFNNASGRIWYYK